MAETIHLIVNGEPCTLKVEHHTLLITLLRDTLGLTSVKEGCKSGDCGACAVLVDGKVVNSCLYLAIDAGGKEVLTVEGLARDGKLDVLQESFLEHGAVQCGYCTPGMLLSAKALLADCPQPTEKEIRYGMAGNLCRCTGYASIVRAVESAARKIKAGCTQRS